MFIFAELFRALAMLVDGVCMILYWLILTRILISWLPVDPYHQAVQIIYQITEPILAPFRRIPLRIGMLDLTPLVAFIALTFIRRVLVTLLMSAAQHFGTGMVY